MPFYGTPHNMEDLTEYSDLIQAAKEYEKQSILFHFFLLSKIKEYQEFKLLSGNCPTFGQYCANCAKLIEKDYSAEAKLFGGGF